MRSPMEIWRTLTSWRRRDAIETGLDDEIRFHVEGQTEKNIRAGMAPDDARRQALLRFGAMQGIKEHVRDEVRTPVIELLLRDLRYSVRALRHAPGFTMAATLTLALGIGATTTMFSVLNGVVLRPLPYPEQDRLVELRHATGIGNIAGSPAVYFGYRDHSQTFESVGLWDWDSSPVTVVGAGEPETVQSVEVTHEILSMLGARFIAGRGFTMADDQPGSEPTAIISHAYWQRRFGGGDAVGRTLTVDGIPRRVVGVLPQGFDFFSYPADIFYPLQLVRTEASFPAGDGRGIARLKPGVTLEQANADVARMIPILDAEFSGGGNAREMGFAPALLPLKERVIGDLGQALWLLMGTIVLLLVIACANVANLILVRTEARAPELAVRAALGAGWGAIARVVWSESALLALAGGVAGVAIAYLSLPFVLSLGASDLPQIMRVGIDPAVLIVAVGTAAFAGILCSLLPLLHHAMPRARLTGAMRDDSRGSTEGRAGSRSRHLLLVAQVAVTLVLLVGAGLMGRAFQTRRAVDPGFRNPETVQTFLLTVPSSADASETLEAGRARVLQMQQDVRERLARIPGVETVGFSSSNDGLPLDGDGRSGPVLFLEGASGGRETRPVELLMVSPGFFEALQAPVVAGRSFDWTDVERRGVVMVSENLARAEWGSIAAAVGKRVAMGPELPRFEVVGVVKDMPQQSLTLTPPETVVFPPMVRNATAAFVLRSDQAGTEALMREVRKALWSVNATLAPASVQTLGEMYRRATARTAMMLMVLAITGAVALLLGLVGVYGIVSFAVSQRRREIGIRLALGSAQGELRLRFVRQALLLVAIGAGIGLAAAAGLTRFMTSQLFGVSPLDLPTHALVTLGLLAAAGLASFVSAYRATALDPVDVLRG